VSGQLGDGHGSRPEQQRRCHHDEAERLVQYDGLDGSKSKRAKEDGQPELGPAEANETAQRANGGTPTQGSYGGTPHPLVPGEEIRLTMPLRRVFG
jgi:hypothetical protein